MAQDLFIKPSSICDPVELDVNGVTEGSFDAGTTIDFQIEDTTGAPITPDSVTVVNQLVTAVIALGGASISTATLMKTGQTTSYRTGDDGDLEAGRATDFLTLAENNPFGNTNRFTDELGGSTYTNDIVIDWSTYNGSTVLGYYRTIGANVTWNTAIDDSLALSVGTFTTGWRLGNLKEIVNINNLELAEGFGYSPFNINAFAFWASTTCKALTTYAFTIEAFARCAIQDKTGASGRGFSVRTFTVTGTTLT